MLALLCMLMSLTGGVFAQSSSDLLIFGGRNNDVFLGCLSCPSSARDSVLNSYGPHGSPYQPQSIWNQYGTYGGRYSSYSPCNSHSQTPPILVSRQGDFYGYLTVNRHKAQRIADRTILDWLENVVCS